MRNYIFLLMLFCMVSCGDRFGNPYDDISDPDETPTETDGLDPTTLEGLHATVFRPTCANSGCHDGTFEPDFRTINSTYNTLVYHPIIKNDPDESYSYRVLPGNPDSSVLMVRLLIDIDDNSGIMPLGLEPDSDWEEQSATNIANIRTWIQNGAPN